MDTLFVYGRDVAVSYAHRWAYGRNPQYFDYEHLGGDCTNFASQCLFAGSGVMNWEPGLGWYYADANRKAPAWTGVAFLWNFLTRRKASVGPLGEACGLAELQPGDLIQLSFDGQQYSHSPIVVAVGAPVLPETVLVAAHSYDTDHRPLSSFSYEKARFLHITGVIRH